MNITVEKIERTVKVNVITRNVIVSKPENNIVVNRVGRKGEQGEQGIQGPPGPPGPGSSWGDITGDIADQTDLQDALAEKLENITGLIEEGANVDITGSGTSDDPYIISASAATDAEDVSFDPVYLNAITGGFFTGVDNADEAFNRFGDAFIYLASLIGPGDYLTRSINKANHGLSFGNVVRLSGGSESGSGQYVLSDATSLENSWVDGIVINVQDANNFTLCLMGYIPTGFSGLSASQTYYLSTTPGQLSITPPAGQGEVVKPIFRAMGSTRGIFLPHAPAYVNAQDVASSEPRDGLNILLSLEDRTRYALLGGGGSYDGHGFSVANGGDFADGGVDVYNEFVPLWSEYAGDPNQWNFQETFTIEDDAAWGGDLIETAICWKGRNPVPFFEVTAADSATENGSGNGYGEYPSKIYTDNQYNGEMFFLQRVRYTYNPGTGQMIMYRPALSTETPDSNAFGVDWMIADIYDHQNPGPHPMAPVDPTKPLRIGKGSGRYLVSRIIVNSFDGTPYCDFNPSDNMVDEDTVYDPVLDDDWTNNDSSFPIKIIESDVFIKNWTSDIAAKQPLDSDLTDIAALTPTNDDFLQRKSGAWTNRTPAQVLADLPTPYPRFVDLNPAITPILAGTSPGWSMFPIASVNGAYWQFSTAANDCTATWEILLDSGTWSLEMFYRSATTNGIATWKIDGVSIGTVDTYNGVSANGNNAVISGIVIATPGRHTLELSNPTKNASASAYRVQPQSIGMVRTGA